MPNTSDKSLIKIFNPILTTVKTYKSSAQVIKIGSGDNVDLQIFLPSLQAEHIIVDLDGQKIMAIGNDVHCDTIALPPGSSLHFSNDSVIRIHNIFMGFYKLGGAFSPNVYDKRLISAASQYREFSPVFKIVHCNCQDNDDFNIDEGIATRNSERQLQVSDMMADFYKKEIGDISGMPPVEPHMSKLAGPSNQFHSNPADKAIEATRKEFEATYNSEPSSKILEAAIERKLEDINEQAIEALDGMVDIPLVRHPHSDLGTMAIDNSILQEARAEIQSVGSDEEKNRILEAQINSVDQLRNSITDNIKEEMRESILKIVQEEVQDKIDVAVEECIQSSKITDAIVEQVTEKVLENESFDEKMKSREVEDKESSSVPDAISIEKVSAKTDKKTGAKTDKTAGKTKGSGQEEKPAPKTATKRKADEHTENTTEINGDGQTGRKRRKAAVSNAAPKPEEATKKTNTKSRKDEGTKDKGLASKKGKKPTESS